MGLRNKMNILVGQNHLDTVGGSEKYCYTLIEILVKQGHDVDLILGNSGRKGIVSDRIKNDFDVDNITEKVTKKSYDLALLSHISTVEKVMSSKIKIQKDCIFQIVHGTVPKLEQPYLSNKIKYISISEEVGSYLFSKYNKKSIVLRNFVNINKFKPSKYSENLASVLSLCQNDIFNNYLFKICSSLGLDFKALNKFKNPTFDVEDTFSSVDLIITLGRGCYEGMSCGRNILIADHRSYQNPLADGLVTKENFFDFVKFNCSGRSSKISPTEKFIKNELLSYSAENGRDMRKLACEYLCADKQIEKLINFIIKEKT